MNKKQAFTLSEVLITLGIIGVVAAITLPAIHSNIQNHVLKNQFKKSYANLFNAMNRAEAENGVPFACGNVSGKYTSTECTSFWTKVLEQFKVLNTGCKMGSSTDCSPVYKEKSDVLAEGGGVNNNSCSFFTSKNNVIVYHLIDGSIIIVSGNHGGMYFALDTNGMKRPNKWGYDLFYMTIDRRNNKLNLTDNVCAMWEKGGQRVEDMLYNK